MASPALEARVLAGPVHRLLVDHQRGGRLEADAHQNVLPVGDAALDAAGMVGCCPDAAVLHAEGIVVFQPGHFRGVESGTHGERLGGGNAHHGVGQRGVQLVENGVPQSGRAAAHRALDHSAQGIARVPRFLDGGDHGFRHGGISRADDVALHRGGGYGRPVHGGLHPVHLVHPGDDFHIGKRLLQHGLRHGSGSYAADGFPGGGTPPSGPGADAVFGIVRVVRMGRAVGMRHLVVGGGTVVLVAHADGDGRAQRPAIQHAGKDFRAVLLLARGHDVALARPAPVQFPLDILLCHRNERRTAVYHHTHPGSMGLSPRGYTEHLAKIAGHGGILDAAVRPVKPQAAAAGHKKHPGQRWPEC